jgi:ABC-type uncharacterized transport system substrate-binding protein
VRGVRWSASDEVNRALIRTLVKGARLPTIYNSREYVETGGLMSYGPNWLDRWKRTAEIVDKILRGNEASRHLSRAVDQI